MSRLIPINSVPNQSFTVILDGVRYAIEIRDLFGLMSVSVIKSDVFLARNVLAVGDRFILPYEYLATDGNFAFSTFNNELPYWDKFNVTQFLYHYSADEVANGRVA